MRTDGTCVETRICARTLAAAPASMKMRRMGSPSHHAALRLRHGGARGVRGALDVPDCGRTTTPRIPSADYDAIRRSTAATGGPARRSCGDGAGGAGGRATGQLLPIFAGLGVVLIGWFLYIKPFVHRRHKRAVSELTRNWELDAPE